MKKRLLSLILIFTLLMPALTSCDNDEDKAQLLSFSQTQSVSEMEKLDGKTVTIIGYMSTLSPVSGAFMYLMNLPYQSCPFCLPNSTTLSNTIAVYAKDKEGFEFTDRAIRVTGTLEFGNYTDEFGYEYGYRIKDAYYSVLDVSDLSEELKLWQQLAQTDVISEIYTMFEYVNFVCFWPSYTAKFDDGEDYLYPSDALSFIETDGAQFNYGVDEEYFDSIKAKVLEVDLEAFSELIAVIDEAKALSVRAYSELKGGNYTTVSEYSGTFGDGRTQYKLNASAELEAQMDAVYGRFSNWLAAWEL